MTTFKWCNEFSFTKCNCKENECSKLKEFNKINMPNYYELKQTTLMEIEIAELVAKIQRLEKEIALKEQEIKQLKMLNLALADQ